MRLRTFSFFILLFSLFALDIAAQNRPRTSTTSRPTTRTTTRPPARTTPPRATPARPATPNANANKPKPATPATPATSATPTLAKPDTTTTSGVFAEITTPKGVILCKLYYEHAPLTVANFVGLAEGTKNSVKPLGTPFYNGLKWHRVVPDFVIQGGDPNGNGSGGPGYSFADEFHPDLKHDGAGILSMANSGPATNGSQFFITHKATAWLDNKHSVFGRVVKGQNVVNAIQQGDDIISMKIIRKGPKAQLFVIDQAKFDALAQVANARQTQMQEEKIRNAEARVKELYPNAQKTASGIYYVIEQQGTGPKPVKNADLKFHAIGKMLDGQDLDNTRTRNSPGSVKLGALPMIKGIEEVLYDMKQGERRISIIPASLTYLTDPKQTVFQNGQYLIYDIELLEVKLPENK